MPASLVHMAIVQERATNNRLSIRRVLPSMALAYIVAHNCPISIARGGSDGPVFFCFAVFIFRLDTRLVEEVYEAARVGILLHKQMTPGVANGWLMHEDSVATQWSLVFLWCPPFSRSSHDQDLVLVLG
ncbi:hypothetical protein HG531_013999 [Fusarium graminearum]|nr:hypothetical protein HG531_013999 [Fusarium graminearum]